MLVEHRPVSRKTPLDGRLEITPEAAARLAPLGAEFPLVSAGREGTGRLEALPCSCAKSAATGAHVHHFVASPLLRALAPGSEVRVELDESRGGLRIDPA